MEIQVCFTEKGPKDRVLQLPQGTVTVPGGTGVWLDLDPGFDLSDTDFPDEVMRAIRRVTLPEGVEAVRVLTRSEVWMFYVHPTYGMVPRLEDEAGAVVERWPSNQELGGVWVVSHVLPDGNLLPMCYVEPDPMFMMGDAESQNRRKVSVPGGFMGLTPATVRQWNWYAKANAKPLKPTSVKETKTGVTINLEDHPVTEVSYWDSCEFAKWAGVEIPTEEMWEHAARGSDGRKFPWGNNPPTDELCHSSIHVQKERTDEVYNRPAGASPYGCCDMAGNVWEWTSTEHK